MARLTSSRRARLIKRRDQYEAELDGLHELHSMMASGDVQNYTIGSRNLSRYKNIAEVDAAIKWREDKIDEIEAELNGHRRKAIAIVPRDV